MATSLKEQHCTPCQGGADPLKGAALEDMAQSLASGWEVVDEHHLTRAYSCGGWKDAVDLTNRIAVIAEEEDHHPDLCLSYGKVTVKLFTHKIGGLSENDFILAAKIEEAAS